MDVNKLLTNIADFNLSSEAINNGFQEISFDDMSKSICFDISANRIGIGTVDPSYTIDIRGTQYDKKDIYINRDGESYNVYESINILFKLIKDIHNRAIDASDKPIKDLLDIDTSINNIDGYNLYQTFSSS